MLKKLKECDETLDKILNGKQKIKLNHDGCSFDVETFDDPPFSAIAKYAKEQELKRQQLEDPNNTGRKPKKSRK